ncbi:hypothetical protein RHMOL_Rhmol04G0251600 [Rhododendron molle]|uniref:Uncharacterized protein n=1 Tax=Rhododendron molle TaxID=49168 RepID=A0ACC0P5G8_RHOML|nr:hypothetical protein RHMOL_Rhmol04G0251600 [Rhododendron molle]
MNEVTKSLLCQTPTITNGYIRQTLHGANGLNYAAYGRLIQSCTDRRLLRQASSSTPASCSPPSSSTTSSLITLYSKSGHLREAHRGFDEIPHRNTFPWNALLAGYSFNNLHVETLELFSNWLSSPSGFAKPDNFTITSVLKALSSLFPDLKLAKMFHAFVVQNGFDSDVFAMNPLVTYYSRCDDVASARKWFDAMPEKDIVTWNSMIAAYSQEGYYEDCKRLYGEILDLEGLRPNWVTVLSVLQACGQSNDLLFGMDVHQFIVANDIEMDLSICNSLMALYAKCGSLDYARERLENMSEKNDVTYGAIISGYMVHGFVEQAFDLFREMKSPALSAWNAVISGLIQNNRPEGALDLFREKQSSELRPNSVTLSSILLSVSHFSNLKAIISAHAAHGDANAALDLLEKMLNNGTQPDPVTFTAVLTACSRSGVVDEVWKNFDAMLVKYRIQSTVEHYACIVGVLSRAGKLSEAVEFICKMPIEPIATVWGALLNGASVSGDVELGMFVCDRLFEIEPENTGNYIILANLFSRAGRWEEAEKVREKMKNLGLKKIPGSSWIETSGGLQTFIAKDVSNGRTGEIYAMLDRLLSIRMRDERYVLMDEFDEVLHN